MHITDEDAETRDRAGMTPLLESMGGCFRSDRRVFERLKGDADEPFNRVFILCFPNDATRDRFFTDPDDLRVREAHFTGAVRSFRILATYHHA